MVGYTQHEERRATPISTVDRVEVLPVRPGAGSYSQPLNGLLYSADDPTRGQLADG